MSGICTFITMVIWFYVIPPLSPLCLTLLPQCCGQLSISANTRPPVLVWNSLQPWQEALCFQVVHYILINTISQECLEGISSNLAQTSTWIQGSTDQILVVKGQGHREIRKKYFFLPSWRCVWNIHDLEFVAFFAATSIFLFSFFNLPLFNQEETYWD